MEKTSASQTMNTPSDIIHVMLVDDSAVVRGLMTRALQQDIRINVVATASDGEMALRILPRHQIDVIILDIEMPNMDGLTALPKLLELSPSTRVIMASTLTHRNADISMQALEIGASDYVPKPSSQRDNSAVENFYRELKEKVKVLGTAAKEAAAPAAPAAQAPISAPPSPVESAVTELPVRKITPSEQYQGKPIHAIAIASSTGGPQALMKLLKETKAYVEQLPVFITQHMPPTFTTLLAEHLSRDSECACVEAKDAQAVDKGTVYIAPGDYHLIVKKDDSGLPKITLNQDPPVNFCRPAADPMLESLLEVYGDRLLVIVLTGMGNDGLTGARKAVEIGAPVVVQDKASSAVWGMPGAVAEAGLASAVLSLSDMGAYIGDAVGRR